LRWLTRRGANTDAGQHRGQRNRPVLMHADDTLIKESEARNNLGAISQFIKTFPTRLEATMFEERLQRSINHYHLGHRLHRFVAMGRHIDDEFLNPTCRVFITAIPILPHTLQRETVTTATNVDLKIVR